MIQKLQLRLHSVQGSLAQRLVIKDILYLVIAVSIFAVILLNRSPNFLRPISLSLRTGLNIVVGLYFVILYFAFRLRGWSGQLFSLALTLALFAFSLAGLWAIGLTQPTVFNGIVPLFDASDYYSDALRLLAGQDFSVFSARRPLYPGLLSAVLWVSNHNLMTALSIFTLITALACFAAVKEIQRTHGVEVATCVLALLFLYYRYHSGLVMSENLGLPLGVLGFALLWRGISKRGHFSALVGLFLITLALNARAGTFFMLPLLLLWAGWVFRKPSKAFSWSFLALGVTAVILGFVLNLIMFRLLATPSGVPFANFSYSLYGLASGGKSWIYVFESHPELRQLQEPFQSREIYRMAFELIRSEPELLIKGALYNWSMLFSNTWYSAYSFVAGENPIIGMIAQRGLFLLCILGFVRWARNPDDTLNGLVCVASVGVLISVPFLPPTDAYRMRPYAASMVIFGLLPAMGLLFGTEMLKISFFTKTRLENTHPYLLTFLVGLILLSSTVGPVLVKYSGSRPNFQQVSCEDDMEFVSIRFDPGTHFNVLRQSAPGLDWMPNFRISRFKRNSHSMADSNMIAWTDRVDPGMSIFYTFDFRTMKKVLIAVPTDRLPPAGTLWQVCGEWESDPVLETYNIFYARTEPKILAD